MNQYEHWHVWQLSTSTARVAVRQSDMSAIEEAGTNTTVHLNSGTVIRVAPNFDSIIADVSKPRQVRD